MIGYYGNPKIKGVDLFDGSQSISSVKKIQKLDIYKNLENLNFHIGQVTVAETFDDSVYGQIQFRVLILWMKELIYIQIIMMIYMKILLNKEKKYILNIIKKIIVIQKIQNYYYLMITAQ